jgi:hypothetical protein
VPAPAPWRGVTSGGVVAVTTAGPGRGATMVDVTSPTPSGRPPSRLRLLVVGAVALATLVLGGCGSAVVRGASPVLATPTTDNVFIPANQNLSDCVGTLERPNCGSASKSDVNMYITFAVLMAGMAAIGWRLTVAIRKRDRDLDEHLPEHTF